MLICSRKKSSLRGRILNFSACPLNSSTSLAREQGCGSQVLNGKLKETAEHKTRFMDCALQLIAQHLSLPSLVYRFRTREN